MEIKDMDWQKNLLFILEFKNTLGIKKNPLKCY